MRETVRVGVGVGRAGAKRWLAAMLESLGAGGVAVALDADVPPEVPGPWSWLLALERLASRPRTDMFRRERLEAIPLDMADADLLVLPPGVATSPEMLARFPLGVLTIEPIHPAGMRSGVLEGRMFWTRPGQAPRLAASTATCAGGPFPLSWAGAHLAKMALMPERFLRRLAIEGDALWASLPQGKPLPAFTPGLADWARFAARLAGYGLTRAWLDLFHRRQWFLALRPGDGDPLRPGFATRPFKPLYPPKGTGWADPVLFSRGGKTWLFIEEIPGQAKGVLSVMEALAGGGFGEPRRVLEEPFHLSYPMVFAHEGQTYMIPETSGARQVRVYRATDFPGGWVLDRVLLDGVSATDATFLEHGGSWWMFVNIRPEGGSSWDELHLYRSASRLGPYEPHPLNPVVSDVRRARPAGPVMRKDGRLFRPAQDSSGWYGRALSVMEIIRLDERGYEEREAARLEPGLIPGSFCLHTLESEGTLEIVDGQRFVPFWR